MEANFFASALKALPDIASSPLSLVAYALTLCAWIFTYQKSTNLKTLMKQIIHIPESKRVEAIVAATGEPVPSNITAEQWIVSKRQQYFLVAFIFTLAVVIIITAIALYRGAQIGAAQASADARIAVCERQARNVMDQWQNNKNILDNRIKQIDEKIKEWRLEERRGMAGIAFAPMDQKELALSIVTGARNNISELNKEKKEAENRIDNLFANQPVPIRCT